jgi:hypothetical protein
MRRTITRIIKMIKAVKTIPLASSLDTPREAYGKNMPTTPTTKLAMVKNQSNIPENPPISTDYNKDK